VQVRAGKKSTALTVETTVLDHWVEASGSAFFGHESHGFSAHFASAEWFDLHIASQTAAENEQITLQHPVHTLIAARVSKVRRSARNKK